MPLDAICLTAVREELIERVVGSRIDKIQQPERDLLVLSLYGAAGPCRMLISSGTGDARVHLTKHRFDNPQAPPMFCMLLRKHLTGARIIGVDQPPAERVLTLEIEALDAMMVSSTKNLIIELIGRTSNIILTEGDGHIIDCMRRIGGELDDKRAVLPGLVYRPPPAQPDKVDPLIVDPDTWRVLFDSVCETMQSKTADAFLLSVFSALSPLICRELSWRAYNDTSIPLSRIHDRGEALCREFFNFVKVTKECRFEPWLIVDIFGSKLDFSYMKIMQYEDAAATSLKTSFSELLDEFYTLSAQRERTRQRASSMTKTVKTALERTLRKLTLQESDLKAAEGRDSLRECGDIIMANLHTMKSGASSLTAEDFFSGNGSVREIALDPLKTPQQNAAKYYKNYSKAKRASLVLTEQVDLGEKEASYLKSVLDELSLAEGEADLSDIRRELIQTGYIKPRKQEKGKQAEQKPLSFISSSGIQIFAGKSNIQNDKLTLKSAQKSDVWLHAQKIHGSHVIASRGSKDIDDTTLYEAAVIAAYYSAARNSGKVPVDHTLVKHVKKPPGARPGLVIYTDHKTLVVEPDEALVKRLKQP